MSTVFLSFIAIVCLFCYADGTACDEKVMFRTVIKWGRSNEVTHVCRKVDGNRADLADDIIVPVGPSTVVNGVTPDAQYICSCDSTRGDARVSLDLGGTGDENSETPVFNRGTLRYHANSPTLDYRVECRQGYLKILYSSGHWLLQNADWLDANRFVCNVE